MTTQSTRHVVAGGLGLTTVCRDCARTLAVETLGDIDCACGATYTVVFPVDERGRVKPKVVSEFEDDLHYVAVCPMCMEEFTGGRSEVGERHCPHCRAPVHVEV